MQNAVGDAGGGSARRSKNHPLIGVVVFVVAFFGGMVLQEQVADAHAYAHSYYSCDYQSQTTRWRFSNDSSQGPDSGSQTLTWPSVYQADVRAGSERWDAVKTETGGRYSDVQETSSTASSVYKVILRNIVPDGWGGKTGCYQGQAVMVLDFTKEDGAWIQQDSMRGITAHEFGHTVGLNHGGVVDNLWNQTRFPTMSTGIGSFGHWPNELASLEPDDRGNLGSVSLGSPLGGNPSFEQGSVDGWVKQSGASWSLYGSGSAKGYYHVREYGYGKYILNSDRVWDLPDSRDLQAVVWNRDVGNMATGSIRVDLYARRVEWDSHHEDVNDWCFISGCPYLNTATPIGSWSVKKSFYVWPTASWDDDYSAWWDVPDDWDGVDVYVRITNYMTDLDGNSTWMYIDDSYVRAL